MTARKVLLEIAETIENSIRLNEGHYRLTDWGRGYLEAEKSFAAGLRAKAATLPEEILPKPDHAEEGQMWTRWDDHRTVERLRANCGKTEVDFDNGQWERAETLLTSPEWRYLGTKEKR